MAHELPICTLCMDAKFAISDFVYSPICTQGMAATVTIAMNITAPLSTFTVIPYPLLSINVIVLQRHYRILKEMKVNDYQSTTVAQDYLC